MLLSLYCKIHFEQTNSVFQEEAPRISLAAKLGKFVDSEPEDEGL